MQNESNRSIRESNPRPSFSRFLSSLAVLSVLSSGLAQAQKYQVSVLPKIKGGTFATATAINDVNQVVGYADDAAGFSNAVLWSHGSLIQLFPGTPLGSSAVAINDAGVVVGYETGAFAWISSVVYSTGYQVSDANGINARGQIIGSQEGIPAVWSSPSMLGVSFSAPTPPKGNDVQNVALTAINDGGVIVGVVYSMADNTVFHATRWSSSAPDAKITDLGTLGGPASQPNAINPHGWIVGWAQLGNGRQHAALWEPSTHAYDLGTLGGNASSASSIDRQGNIGGSAQTIAGDWHAVLWTPKHFKSVDLNTEISPAAAKSITLVDAVGMNDECRIVVNGIDRKSGADEVFLLTPAESRTCTGQ